MGDIISSDGTIDLKVENGRQKGVGICSQVSGIMNGVSLGFFFYKISYTLRESMLLNGILTNVEVWYAIKTKHVEVFESVDLMLLKKIMNAHSMTAKEAFFLEAGILPIKFIICKRRLLYLWTILHRKEEELLPRFYQAQRIDTAKNDWVELVEKDKKDLDIILSNEEIRNMKECKFKGIVERAIKAKALDYLNNIASGHSKTKKMVKTNLDREKYLEDPRFTRSDVELLFCLRTRMVEVKGNFPNKYGDDIGCKLCKVQVETQEHLLNCEEIKKDVDIPLNVAYEDIFRNSDKQLEIVKAYKSILRQREIILSSDSSI